MHHGNTFGIEDMDLLETLDDDLANQNECKLEVLMSPTLLTHMKKVLTADKEAMAVLNRIRGTRIPQPKPVEKGPNDYPLPPSPESNSSSDKGNFDHHYLIFKLVIMLYAIV